LKAETDKKASLQASSKVNDIDDSKKVAALFLLREDGAALLQHRDDKPGLAHAGKWTPPGGHCEPDEELDACVRREFLEETGYDCDQFHLLGDFREDTVEGCRPYLVTFFFASYDGQQSIRCLEGQAIEFVERAHAHRYLIPPHLLEIWDLAIASLSRVKSGKGQQSLSL
jgi:8-oxo-dGTP diphosphatase